MNNILETIKYESEGMVKSLAVYPGGIMISGDITLNLTAVVAFDFVPNAQANIVMTGGAFITTHADTARAIRKAWMAWHAGEIK